MKTYPCKHCGERFKRYEIPSHTRICSKRPAPEVNGKPRKPYKPRKTAPAPSLLRFCPHCGANLTVIGAALSAAEVLTNGKS